MSEPTTLKELLAAHPDWADLPIKIYDGHSVDWLSGAGSVYITYSCKHADVDPTGEGVNCPAVQRGDDVESCDQKYQTLTFAMN